MGKSFTRNGVIYAKSFETTDIKISINQLTLKIEPSNIYANIDDALLPYGLRVPAKKEYVIDPRLGTIVWDYQKPTCPQHGQPVKGFQTIYQGQADVKLRSSATIDDQYEGALFSITNQKPHNANIPQNFALAIHSNASICGRLAYSTNIDNVAIIVLRHGDTGINTDKKFGLSHPHILSFKSQVTAQFLDSNLRIEDVAERLYNVQCSTEIKTIRNFLAIVNTATFPSLKPYFSDGFTAVRSGSAVHVLKCKPTKVVIDTARKGCYEQLPVTKVTKNGTPINGTFWSHPITKILLTRGTPVACSEKLPMFYKLSGGTYVCQLGRGLHQCEDPQLFTPTSAEANSNVTHEFHKILGAGILTATKINDLAIRIYEPFYRKIVNSQMIERNVQQPTFNSSTELEPLGTDKFLKSLTDVVGGNVAPLFLTLGKAYLHVVSFFIVYAIFTTIFGILTRLIWEIKNHGYTPRIILIIFNSMWSASRMPLDLLKGGVKGANQNALKVNMIDITNPLQIQIDQLSSAIQQLQSEKSSPTQQTKTPPPHYHNAKESVQVNFVEKHSENLLTSDAPQNNDTPNFYPNLNHPMNRRRSLIIPPNHRQNRRPAITNVPEDMVFDSDGEQLSPLPTLSASSILRNSLANLADKASQKPENASKTSHSGPPLRLRRLPSNHDPTRILPIPQPIGRKWHTTWQPPMPFPPSAPAELPTPTHNQASLLRRRQKSYQPQTKTHMRVQNTNVARPIAPPPTTRYPQGSRADNPQQRFGFTITNQDFTRQGKNLSGEQSRMQTIIISSDDEEPSPTVDPLALEDDIVLPRVPKIKRNRSDDSKP